MVSSTTHRARPSDPGRLFDAGHVTPTRFRRPGVIWSSGVETWVLEDETGDVGVRARLSPAERRLPSAAIWNHEHLLDRIARGWRPELEG